MFNNLPKAKISTEIQPMEMFDQAWGSIIYRRTLPACSKKQTLIIHDVHDWAVIFINGKVIGKLDRRKGENTVELPPLAAESRLDILVEGMGRVNYGEAIIDRKGITKKVTLKSDDKEEVLRNWTIYNIPVNDTLLNQPKFKKQIANGPAWYKSTFNLKRNRLYLSGYEFVGQRYGLGEW